MASFCPAEGAGRLGPDDVRREFWTCAKLGVETDKCEKCRRVKAVAAAGPAPRLWLSRLHVWCEPRKATGPPAYVGARTAWRGSVFSHKVF